jgi:hypothetical protein
VPDLEPLRARDLIRVDGSNTDALCSFIGCVADAIRASASGVVINTFEGIEASELAKIQRELSRPAFAVGPLHFLSQAPAEHSLHAPDRACLAWHCGWNSTLESVLAHKESRCLADARGTYGAPLSKGGHAKLARGTASPSVVRTPSRPP